MSFQPIAIFFAAVVFFSPSLALAAEPSAGSGPPSLSVGSPTPGIGRSPLNEGPVQPGTIDTTTVKTILAHSPKQDCTLKVSVTGIRIVGNTKFPEAVLERNLLKNHQKFQKTKLSLCRLHNMAARLTRFYHRHGYVLSFAVIPPQQIRNGQVTIRIVEGKVGQIRLSNKSLVSTDFLNAILSNRLKSGQVLEQAPLEEAVYYIRDLTNVSDQPKPSVSAVATPGKADASSDILINVNSKDSLLSGSSVTLDDWGNPYTGAERLTGNLVVNSLAGRGDQLAITTQVTGNVFSPGLGPGMEYVHAGYTIPATTFGTRAGIGMTALNYRIIDTALTNLTGNGNGVILNAFVNQTFVHRKREDVNLNLEYDHYILSDVFGSGSNTLNDNRNLDVVTASLVGAHRLPVANRDIRTVASWSVQGSVGNVDFTNGQAQAVDSSTLQTGGLFYRANGSAGLWSYFEGDSRKCQLFDPNKLSVFINAGGQLASKNLDPSQQFILGGPESVASYAEGLLAGSQGGMGQVEIRYDYVRTKDTTVMGKLFYDEGYIEVDRFLPIAGPNSAFLGGPGVGADLKDKNWSGSVAVSVPVGAQPVLVSDNIPGAVSFNPTGFMPVQVWIQAGYKW